MSTSVFAQMARNEVWGLFDYYDDRVREMVARQLVGRAIMLDSELWRCESPIERLMLGALLWELTMAQIERVPDCQHSVTPQYVVTAGTQTYRLDFLVRATIGGRDYKVAVECDGHEFHERTKEQASRDKARDRRLQALGYLAFRFTGTEIVKDPDRCAKEVVRAILDKAGRPAETI